MNYINFQRIPSGTLVTCYGNLGKMTILNRSSSNWMILLVNYQRIATRSPSNMSCCLQEWTSIECCLFRSDTNISWKVIRLSTPLISSPLALVSFHILSYHIIPDIIPHVVSYHNISYHIMSYHVILLSMPIYEHTCVNMHTPYLHHSYPYVWLDKEPRKKTSSDGSEAFFGVTARHGSHLALNRNHACSQDSSWNLIWCLPERC